MNLLLLLNVGLIKPLNYINFLVTSKYYSIIFYSTMNKVDYLYNDEEFEDIFTWLKIYEEYKQGKDTK